MQSQLHHHLAFPHRDQYYHIERAKNKVRNIVGNSKTQALKNLDSIEQKTLYSYKVFLLQFKLKVFLLIPIMTEQITSNQQPLYEDDNVLITSQSVKVKKFYMPQQNKNQIHFKDINKLQLREMDPMDQTLGVDPSFFENFKNKTQQNKNMYIQMAVQDQKVRLSFAPNDPDKVFKLIQKKWEDSKIQSEKKSIEPLQQKDLYSNVEVSKESIEKAMQQLKNSEKPEEKVDTENEKKRSSTSPSRKIKQVQEGQNPKKKIHEDSKKEQNEENIKPKVGAQ